MIILLLGVTGIIYAMVAVKGGASYNPDDPPDPDPVDPVNPYDGEFLLNANIYINGGDIDYSAYNETTTCVELTANINAELNDDDWWSLGIDGAAMSAESANALLYCFANA